VQAGKLRNRITIQMKSTTPDDLGGLDTWTTFATVWASINALQGKQLYKAQTIVGECTHEIVMRWYPDPNNQAVAGPKANMSVLFNGRLFEIMAVMNPDERTKELHLLCIERNDGTVGV
jgi:SPP1 family predicted phage head-tail adaptor